MRFRPLFSLLLGTTISWHLAAQNATVVPSTPTDSPEKLPFGVFPPLQVSDEEFSKNNENLQSEIKDLSKRVQSTVKSFATRRNVTCFDSPCLIQAFPLLYNARGSGFFAGARANLTNISRQSPPLYLLDAQLVRSDTQQWLALLALDLPRIERLPSDPRVKFRMTYSRSTRNRYYGIGPTSYDSEKLDHDIVRYSLKEIGYQSSLLFPMGTVFEDDLRLSFFILLSSIRHRPSPLHLNKPSKLFEDHPLGTYEGGTSSRLGLGFLLDHRDREVFSRAGWATEFSAEIARPPLLGQYSFHRYSLIDRRYWSHDFYTLASRVTLDYLDGEVPFWELSGVGGIDPIQDINGPLLMRAYPFGRYHEKQKVIWNIDHRIHLNPQRIFGIIWETVFIPLGIDIGQMGTQTAWSLAMGANFLLNKSFQVRVFSGYASTGFQYRLAFGQEF